MSVLIRGMEMPKSCYECKLDLRTGVCPAFFEWKENNPYSIKSKGRLPNCPLVEVKTPHGRLVDADRMAVEANEALVSAQIKAKNHLALMINEATHKKVQMMLTYTPSVIEAEEAKNRLE